MGDIFFLITIFISFGCFKESYTYLYFFEDGYEVPYPEIPETCVKPLDEFAHSAANFTMCSINNARPIKMCEGCIKQYVVFKEKYKVLLNTPNNGTTCLSFFISQDRLDAVLHFYNSISSIWNKGNCNACFNWSVHSPEVLSDIKLFNKMYNETMECIENNKNSFKDKTPQLCENCKQLYTTLDKFYNSLSKDEVGIDEICMDVVDSMNATRSIWSKKYDCCKLRRSPEIIFLCCASIISILPILFYLAVRFCGPIRHLPNVLKQSRFKQTLLRSVNGRND